MTMASLYKIGNPNRYRNLITNGGFEVGDPPTGWALAGAGATFAQSIEQVKYGTYSGKLTRSGADCWINFGYDLASNNSSQYLGRKVTYGCWVYATVANRAILQINDGVASAYSSYHTGGSGWEFLTVSLTVDITATIINTLGMILNGDTSAYFDGAVLVGWQDVKPTSHWL